MPTDNERATFESLIVVCAARGNPGTWPAAERAARARFEKEPGETTAMLQSVMPGDVKTELVTCADGSKRIEFYHGKPPSQLARLSAKMNLRPLVAR
jgi:hypothetical protein